MSSIEFSEFEDVILGDPGSPIQFYPPDIEESVLEESVVKLPLIPETQENCAITSVDAQPRVVSPTSASLNGDLPTLNERLQRLSLNGIITKPRNNMLFNFKKTIHRRLRSPYPYPHTPRPVPLMSLQIDPPPFFQLKSRCLLRKTFQRMSNIYVSSFKCSECSSVIRKVQDRSGRTNNTPVSCESRRFPIATQHSVYHPNNNQLNFPYSDQNSSIPEHSKI
ncbi:unnamed protein product [Allacma fusca]|uniref:Uncharacterized protein n=1 Tax=Allacma fusca TaxID=39272 RepID=A0A8J2KXI2_9HEXA|nr:unnamed protein product [Allacma fusca]